MCSYNARNNSKVLENTAHYLQSVITCKELNVRGIEKCFHCAEKKTPKE